MLTSKFIIDGVLNQVEQLRNTYGASSITTSEKEKSIIIQCGYHRIVSSGWSVFQRLLVRVMLEDVLTHWMGPT